jgi:hypothetical protein
MENSMAPQQGIAARGFDNKHFRNYQESTRTSYSN